MHNPREHYYDGWIYARVIDGNLTRLRRRISKWIPPGSTILDVGCGTGDQLFYLKDQISQGLGIELSSKMLEFARKRRAQEQAGHLDFKLMNASRLEGQQDSSYDLALTTMVIHEMPVNERLQTLLEMKRVARKLILVDYRIPQSTLLNRMSIHSIEFLAGWSHYCGFRSFSQQGGMPPLIGQAGLQIEAEQETGNGTIHFWLCS